MEEDRRRAWVERNRDLAGRGSHPWARRTGLLLLVAFVVAALLNVFGQRAEDSSAVGPAATLELNAPSDARGGLIFQARFTIRAAREIKEPLLILDRGWVDGLTLNSTVPEPVGERTDDGRVVIEYDTIPAGRSLVSGSSSRSTRRGSAARTRTSSCGTGRRGCFISTTR